MPNPYPSLQKILAQTRVKVGDLPLQGLANPAFGLGVGLTVLTLILAAPAFFFPSWKALAAPGVLWIYAASLVSMAVAAGLFVLGLVINLLRASHVRAEQFDQQHAAEQDLADLLARTYSREALEPTINRLQLEIEMIENTKAAITAMGALVGSLTPLAALMVPLSAVALKPDDLVKWVLAAAGAGGAISLVLTLRFKDHLTRARHVLQRAQQHVPAGSLPEPAGTAQERPASLATGTAVAP